MHFLAVVMMDGENFQRRCGSAMDDELRSRVVCAKGGKKREEGARFCLQAENWRRLEKKKNKRARRTTGGPQADHRRGGPTHVHSRLSQAAPSKVTRSAAARSVVTCSGPSPETYLSRRNGTVAPKRQTGQLGPTGDHAGRAAAVMKGLSASGYPGGATVPRARV